MSDYQDLSENELQTVIDNAEKALKQRQAGKRKEVITQIKELAASINVTVDIKEGDKRSARKGVKVAAKYRHPDDASKTWTGRGIKPIWVRTLLASGHSLEDITIK